MGFTFRFWDGDKAACAVQRAIDPAANDFRDPNPSLFQPAGIAARSPRQIGCHNGTNRSWLKQVSVYTDPTFLKRFSPKSSWFWQYSTPNSRLCNCMISQRLTLTPLTSRHLPPIPVVFHSCFSLSSSLLCRNSLLSSLHTLSSRSLQQKWQPACQQPF